MNRLHQLCSLFLALAMMAALASCGAQEGGGDPAGEPEAGPSAPALSAEDTTFGITPLASPTTVRIGYMVGSLHNNAIVVAEKKGWLAELNIQVEYLPFTNGPIMMEAMNDWDFGTTGVPGVITGMVGRDLVMFGVGPTDSMLDLYVREDSPIYQRGQGHIDGYPDIYGTPEDWRGTTWLLPIGTTLHYALAATLEAMDLTPDDVTMVNMDVGSALNAFKAGEGDGAGLWSSVAMMAEENGYLKVGGSTYARRTVNTGVFANPNYLANNRETVKKMLEIYYAAAEWSFRPENIDESAQIFLDACLDQGVNMTFEGCRKIYVDSTQVLLPEQIEMCRCTAADPQGLYGEMTEMDMTVIDIFDFFQDLGSYDAGAREHILDGCIDLSLLLELEADYLAEGKSLLFTE